MASIHFFFPFKKFSFTQRTRLKSFIRNIFKKEKKTFIKLRFIFCSDAYLLEINRQYLQHDYYTDIITFDLGEAGNIDGEIYISVERVKENAGLMQTSFKEELHRVIFHGVLHLCGYKDKLKSEMVEMRSKEDRLLQLYFKKQPGST